MIKCYTTKGTFTVKSIGDLIRKRYNGYILNRKNSPAILFEDGSKEWWANGKLHREDGPAVIYNKYTEFLHFNLYKHRKFFCNMTNIFPGYKQWWVDGRPHRENAPAIIDSFGSEIYYLNGVRGKCIVKRNLSYFFNDEKRPHNDYGPSIVTVKNTDYLEGELNYNSYHLRNLIDKIVWYTDGKMNREDGPAYISDKNIKWFKYGKLHRLDGPAIYNYYNTRRWFISGKSINRTQVENWIKKNNIDLKTKAGQTMFMLKFG